MSCVIAKTSYITTLRSELRSIVAAVEKLLEESTIINLRNDPDISTVFIGWPYSWGKVDEPQKILQLELLPKYTSWMEHIRLLFLQAPNKIQKEIENADGYFGALIQQENGFKVPISIEQGKQKLHEVAINLAALLDLAEKHGTSGMIVVPDTNSLLLSPDLHRYSSILGTSIYTVIFLPTILSELDHLKCVHHEEKFRRKVESVINRIKGFRNQGDLHHGVITYKTITVQMIAQEPDFGHTLSWLDSSNNDDRIIASSLEMQRLHPSATVILCTVDINLQNKAEMARLPYFEPPKSERTVE